MPNPRQSYILGGTCYKGIVKGFSKIQHTVDTSEGGINTLDIYFGGTSTLLTSQTLNITLIREGEVISTDTTDPTSSTGKYIYDLNELEYENGDLVEISGSTSLASLDNTEEPTMSTEKSWHDASNSFRRILVAPDGTAVSSDAPLPVNLNADNLQFANVRRVITKEGPQGRPSRIDYYYKGKQYMQTITYSGTTEDWSTIDEV